MSRRQSFADTLKHQTPERLILDLGGCPLSSMEGESEQRVLDFLGYGKKQSEEECMFGKTHRLDERLLEYLDIDTRSVGEIFVPKKSQFKKLSDTEYIDEWGICRRFTGLYWDAVNAPLKDATLEELEAYPFPDPDSIDEREIEFHARRAKELYENTDYIICAEHPVYGIFELGCWMCGFEDFLYRMLAEPEFVHCFFKRVLEYQKAVIERYYSAVGPYIHSTSSGDDFATQNGPFVSPALFAETIKPYFKERISYTKRFTGAAFLHHSCGSVFSLAEDLIDSGVEILNPIQPKAADMQPEKLKDAFGGRIVFHGGIDTQEVLPFLPPEQVEDVVRQTIQIMNRDGGYVFAAAHNIQPDVNPENLVVMFQAARKYGKRA